MKWLALMVGLAAAAATPAADTAAVGRDRAGDPVPGSLFDGTREWKWDNGTWKYFVYWYTGEGSWVGNDFAEGSPADSQGRRITSLKLFSTDVIPNDSWDGFRVAIYEFKGVPSPVPGEMIWPTSGAGRFFLPAGQSGHGWVSVPINWVVTTSFVAAVEQVYDAPDCDPFAVDSNPTELGHTWSYYRDLWRRFESTADPYRNAMLRVVIEDLPYRPSVSPASFGRVRALFR
jgi:hypothetical protein